MNDTGNEIERPSNSDYSNIIIFNNPKSPLIDHISNLIGIEQVELIDDIPTTPREDHPLLNEPFFLVYSLERTIKTIILINPVTSDFKNYINWKAFYNELQNDDPRYKRLIVRNPDFIPLSAILRNI